jgi:hypothetical protein
MAAYKSEQLGLVDGVGAERVENGDFFGRKRTDYFSVNTADELNGTSTAAADTVELARIPKGARIHGIFLCNEDLGTDVDLDIGIFGTDGSGTYNIAGTADDDDFFTATVTDLATASATPANQVDNYAASEYLTQKAVTIKGSIVDGGTISVTNDKEFKGYVEYTVD